MRNRVVVLTVENLHRRESIGFHQADRTRRARGIIGSTSSSTNRRTPIASVGSYSDSVAAYRKVDTHQDG